MRPPAGRCLAALAACALFAGAAAAQDTFNDRDAQTCPAGTVRVPTNSVYEPFHCVKQMDADTPFIRMTPLYKTRACPKGSHAVDTPGLGQHRRYRCVMDGPRASAQPDALGALSPAGARRRRRGKAPAPAAGVPGFKAPRAYTRYTVRGQFQLDAPTGWHISDGWDDEVPTFYIELDTGRQGKQVTLVVSKNWKGQEGYLDEDAAVAREKDWQNARERAPGRVGGFPARFTEIARGAETAYVATGEDSYYILSYTAPDDLFSTFEPAYRRLLDSFRVSRAGR